MDINKSELLGTDSFVLLDRFTAKLHKTQLLCTIPSKTDVVQSIVGVLCSCLLLSRICNIWDYMQTWHFMRTERKAISLCRNGVLLKLLCNVLLLGIIITLQIHLLYSYLYELQTTGYILLGIVKHYMFDLCGRFLIAH
jgi:hypothetical protein